jgi:hypothetical protein
LFFKHAPDTRTLFSSQFQLELTLINYCDGWWGQQSFQFLFQNFDSFNFLVLRLQVVVPNDERLVVLRLQQPDAQRGQPAELGAADEAVVKANNQNADPGN